jgi:hypothetical protein
MEREKYADLWNVQISRSAHKNPAFHLAEWKAGIEEL